MPRLGEAIPLLRALASSYPDFVPLLGESLNTIGGLEASLSKWDDAGPHFEEAERVERPLAEKNLIQFGPMLGMIYNNLAAYHQLKGNYPEAERYAQNAVEVRKRLASSEASFQPLVLNSLFSLAALYRAQKKWLEATRTSEEALAISRRLPMTSTNQIVVAEQLGSMAAAEIGAGYRDEASTHLNEGLASYAEAARDQGCTSLLTSSVLVMSGTLGDKGLKCEFLQKAKRLLSEARALDQIDAALKACQ